MEVDGFFAALTCSPEIAKPNEYLAELWGEMTDDEAFASQQEFQEFLSLTDVGISGAVPAIYRYFAP